MQTPQDNLRDPNYGDPRRRLVLIGPSVRAAAESARLAGFLPIGIDDFGDQDTQTACISWFPLDQLRSQMMAGHAAELTGTSRLRIVGGLAGGYDWLAPVANRIEGPPLQAFRDSTSPFVLAELAQAASVDFPSVRHDYAGPNGWLIKSSISSGGLGVRTAIANEPVPKGCFAQERISGKVCGATLIANGNDAKLLGACRLLRKRFPDRPFVFAGAIGPVPISASVQSQLAAVAEQWLKRYPMSGPLNIDFVCDRAGRSITLLEINPRYSASMELIERSWTAATGIDVSVFEPPEHWFRRPRPVALRSYLKRIVFTKSACRISPSDFDQSGRLAPQTVAPALKEFQWKDIPAKTSNVPASCPLATMIVPFERDRLSQSIRCRASV
ncbi:ATP-grasp domain-containing protein [Stieleria sp. JC731]|uniref:ATP-grasp domain-containing protein n=1 Tax=Pirellulaceae TaxID=2691357 RepID=UPI001E3E275F|nr:ATP-grasp domain-containing protein [Stieleria sp. JC731]MCC9600256.1 ATP-grasp domain-containing protein [Stieleria sp. JC731]